MSSTAQQSKVKIFTIPNILSLFRLALIPIICHYYLAKGKYLITAGLLVLSGATDVIDGFIARRFNMVSDVGKALDPIADKLTQAAVLFCLVSRFPHMMIPFVLLAVKEITTGITSLAAVRKTGEVHSAQWHGKLTTVLLYSMMFLHLVWFNIPPIVSDLTIAACTAVMLLSFSLYTVRNAKMLFGKGK